jgi:CheY-like chemotaxis protein
LHLLVAEDNTVNQKLALRLLERMGYRADVAANGLEVLEALRRQHYDVILMDVQMPEMDGLQATRRIRENERQTGGHLPIIALTAHAMPADLEKAMEAGCDDYDTKPVELPRLIEKIERLLRIDADGAPVPREAEGR